MSFSKIILPNALLADLYKDVLVVIDNEINTEKKINNEEAVIAEKGMILVNKTVVKTPDEKVEKGLLWLGSNRKNIAVVVRDEGALHLQDEHLEILSAILSACKLNLADVAIVNTHNQQVDDVVLRSELKPLSVLLFGVETAQISLPFSIPDYKLQAFNNCTYLQAAPLDKMKGHATEAKLEKSRLWVCLKTLFGV